MLSGEEVAFVGSKGLMSRPMTVYETLAKENGLSFKKDDDRITVCGPLCAGEYFIDGSVSSQFITGMLLALSTLSGDSRIIINKRLESESYVNMTVDSMAKFGIRVYREGDYSFFMFGGQQYRARDTVVEGDWSGAAFLFALDSISAVGQVSVGGLDEQSLQGDRIFRDLLASLEEGYAEIDISDCPDLGPILFTLAAINHGARFTGTKRLRDKESDRIASMQKELAKFGAELVAEENAATVIKRQLHAPCERLCGHNDHRIVMSLAVISTLLGGEIEGCEAVTKSYPGFFEDLGVLGISSHERG
jgi:3-phosphoshikimate 1-carboxyvinyltransferase